MPRPQPGKADDLEEATEQLWRAHYGQAIAKLRTEGIRVVEDVEEGADKYLALRLQWGAYVVAFADYMLYEWDEVAAQETNVGGS